MGTNRTPDATGPRVRCLFCGGVRPSAGAPCATCGASPPCELTPASVGERVRCPRCPGELVGTSLAGPVLLQCTACIGCFAPARGWSELLEMVSAGEPAPLAAFVPLPPGRELDRSTMLNPIRCPRCTRGTDRITFGVRSGVVADVCPQHGIWFDAAEIVTAVLFVRRREENGGVVAVSDDERRQEMQDELRNEQRRLAAREAMAKDEQERQQNARLTGLESEAMGRRGWGSGSDD